jgi:3-phytase
MKLLKPALLAAVYMLQVAPYGHASPHSLVPDFETEASPYQGDSMDDAAFWHHPESSADSVILTTVKASNQMPVKPTGIITYDLSGKQLQFLEDGTPNNIDARRAFPFEDGSDQIIGASHWYTDEIGLYRMDAATRQLGRIGGFDTGVARLRGFCLGQVAGNYYTFAVGSDGNIEQHLLASDLTHTLINSWQLESESEGCVVDDESGRLFVSEENRGIWWIDLFRPDAEPIALDQVRLFGPLKRGLEGLSLVKVGNTSHLVVSVQEKSRFAIYDLARDEYIGSFTIKASKGTDPVSKTDGIHVEQFDAERGYFIVHDDDNDRPAKNQNFKVLALQSLIELITQLNTNL